MLVKLNWNYFQIIELMAVKLNWNQHNTDAQPAWILPPRFAVFISLFFSGQRFIPTLHIAY